MHSRCISSGRMAYFSVVKARVNCMSQRVVVVAHAAVDRHRKKKTVEGLHHLMVGSPDFIGSGS